MGRGRCSCGRPYRRLTVRPFGDDRVVHVTGCPGCVVSEANMAAMRKMLDALRIEPSPPPEPQERADG